MLSALACGRLAESLCTASTHDRTGTAVGGFERRAYWCRVSPANRFLGSSDCHSTVCPQSTRNSMHRAARNLRNMRTMTSATFWFGDTSSQAPPVFSAISRNRLSAGALPTPIANTRWPELCALRITSSTSQMSPSVINSTSVARSGAGKRVKNCFQSRLWPCLKVDNNAAFISVPPMSACVLPIRSATSLIVAVLQVRRPGKSCWTLWPKRL